MSRHAVIDTTTGRVVNVIEYDSEQSWTAPGGQSLVESLKCAEAQIGDTWDGTDFVPSDAPLVINPLQPHIDRCRAYAVSAAAGDIAEQLNTYLATASPTAADTLKVVKETIRTLRSLIRVTRSGALKE